MGLSDKDSDIVVVAHKFLTQPDDDLVLFLNKQKRANVLHIYHSFSDSPDRKSCAVWYKNGKKFRTFNTADYKNFPEILIYLKEIGFTFWIILRTRRTWAAYVGMDGLCVLFGNLLRLFGVVRKTIYWAIDFVPQKRFSSGIKNHIYHRINITGYKRADEMWDLSPRMAEAREKFLGIQRSEYRLHRVVPYGVWLDRIKRYSYEECERNTLVFMGHLIEKQGAQMVIQAIPEIVKKVPDFKFKIIGDGNYKEQLIALAERLGVLKYCDFRGKIDDILELEKEVAKSAVAIAPYIKSLDTWTYYADPGKVKTYLACGVPLLLTDIPWNAREIESHRCGMIIAENIPDVISKLLLLMQAGNNSEYRKNTVIYSQRFDYGSIFQSLL